MNNSFELRDKNPYVWGKLNEFFNGGESGFPCLFAISSFNKGAMRVGAANGATRESVAKKISSDLIELSKHITEELHEPDLSLITYVAVINTSNHEESTGDETQFLTQLLQDLHNLDPEKWPDNKTTKMNDPEFEFYYNGKIWFPVFLTPSHRSKIRRAPFVMIAFQPGRTFDFNKTVERHFYDRMRQSIHRRIDDFYDNNRPHYLSNKSSGKNICQYIGYDETENNKDFVYKELSTGSNSKCND